MKKLTILIVAVLVLGLTSVLMADVDGAEDETISGTVPFNSQWTFDDSTSANNSAFNDVNTAVYEADSLAIVGVQVCTDLDANDSLWVDAKIGTWTLPADYPASGNKNDGNIDTSSDFKIEVASHCDSLDAVDPFDNETLLTSNDQHILITNTVGGMENSSFTLDAAVLWDWKKDIATNGDTDYSITMTLTINQIVDGAGQN